MNLSDSLGEISVGANHPGKDVYRRLLARSSFVVYALHVSCGRPQAFDSTSKFMNTVDPHPLRKYP